MNQKQQFWRFTARMILFSSPVLLLCVFYLAADPFYVLKAYDAYPDNYLKSYNRNRVSTQVFLNNNKGQQYDSFIFGSSKSSVFYTADWEKHISSKKTYHFDASNESISGIAGKLNFVQKENNKINNALIIIDSETFEYAIDTANSVIHVQDPRWSGQSTFAYHLVFFKAFFKDLYFLKYIDILINKKFKPYMAGVFENKHMLYTPVKNDFIFQEYIDKIKADSIAYYSNDFFYERSGKADTLQNLIKDYQLKFLVQIKEVLARNKTSFKVVISPSYDQKSFSKRDKKILEKYFGAQNIYDFSGQNEFTSEMSNYYEIYHYKPNVAREIMRRVYP